MSFPFLPLCLVSAAVLPLAVQAPGDLSRFRDKNRVLLVFARSASDPRWQRQNKLFAGRRSEFQERDLLRFGVFEAGMQAAHLRARYKVKAGRFRVLLIGKDGHVAFAGPTPVALKEITERIDRMPMRRDEMRRQEQSRQENHR